MLNLHYMETVMDNLQHICFEVDERLKNIHDRIKTNNVFTSKIKRTCTKENLDKAFSDICAIVLAHETIVESDI